MSVAELYVYYRVRPDRTRDAADAVEQLFRAVRAAGGPPGRLLVRSPVELNGLETWMEAYVPAPPALESIVEAAALAAGILPMIEGTRHHERFIPMERKHDPCA